jgi:hypothetical protein
MNCTLHICIKVRQAVAFEQARSRDGSKKSTHWPWILTRKKGKILHNDFLKV